MLLNHQMFFCFFSQKVWLADLPIIEYVYIPPQKESKDRKVNPLSNLHSNNAIPSKINSSWMFMDRSLKTSLFYQLKFRLTPSESATSRGCAAHTFGRPGFLMCLVDSAIRKITDRV